jgi:hypothetical protein
MQAGPHLICRIAKEMGEKVSGTDDAKGSERIIIYAGRSWFKIEDL